VKWQLISMIVSVRYKLTVSLCFQPYNNFFQHYDLIYPIIFISLL